VLFVIYEQDASGSATLREAHLRVHRDYLEQRGDIIAFAAGLVGENDASRVASCLIVDLADRSAAERFASDDPYHRVGVYGDARINAVVKGRWNEFPLGMRANVL
jgi:uncharacterized protein YciI